jgi:hypothetical protein
MDQTSEDNKDAGKQPILSPRKGWDLPHETIMKALELADISSTNPALFEATLKPANKHGLKRGETFVVKDTEDQHTNLTASNNSNRSDLNNEKPPSVLDNLGILEKTNRSILDVVLSPEKMATLKATKNLLLGITLGKFDPKNTKVSYSF